MNIMKKLLVEFKQSIDNLMQKLRDTNVVDCDYCNKLLR